MSSEQCEKECRISKMDSDRHFIGGVIERIKMLANFWWRWMRRDCRASTYRRYTTHGARHSKGVFGILKLREKCMIKEYWAEKQILDSLKACYEDLVVYWAK